MARQTLPENREKNPGQKHYDENIGQGYVTHGQDQLEAFANDPANHTQEETEKSLSNAETQAAGAPKQTEDVRGGETNGSWKNNTSPQSTSNFNQPKINKALTFAKKRGGLIGLIALLGVTGGIIASFFGPASMLINLMENASIKNDSSSTILERRFLKVFGFMTQETDPICANSSNLIKCKKGRISNSALTKLEEKGIKPYFDNDEDNNNRKKTGYPKKNPSGYTISVDGKPGINIKANDLTGYLTNNPKVAAKVLGRGGAFNLRVMAWSGEHISSKFYKKFGLNKDGGIADGSDSNRLSSKERLAAALQKLKSKIPGAEKLGTVVDGIKTKVDSQLGKAKKGGTAYMLAVAGCIGVKAPGYIAAGVAAVQLAQVMPFGWDLVLSPASKAKASGVDVVNSVTAGDMEATGTILTEKVPRPGDGKLTSALDSPTLQSAIGVNKTKPPVSKNFAPGFSVLTNPGIIASQKAAKASEPACNAIMSPAAMWSAFAVDSAITVAASTTIIGGLIKVVGAFFIGEIVVEVVKNVAGDAAKAALVEVAKNDLIPNARGQALGDVTGLALMSIFSGQGMARHIPVGKVSQIKAFAEIEKENIAFQKEMDVASLSPFDTSSRYTALGSVVNSMRLAILSGGLYNGSFSSVISSLARLPSTLLTTNVNAAEFDDTYCGYAGDYGLEAGANTPAINASGTPCPLMTPEQINMETEQGIDLIQSEGWIDETKQLNETDTIDEMVTSGYIKADTPITENIDSCSDISTGNYLFNAAGCTVNSASDKTVAGGDCYENSEGEQLCTTSGTAEYQDPSIETASTASLSAVSVFLVDYQAIQMINGDDIFDGSTVTQTQNTGRPANAVDAGQGWTLAPNTDYAAGATCDPRTPDAGTHTNASRGFTVKLCTITFNTGNNSDNGSNSVNALISTNVMNMFEAARADGVELGLSDGMRKVGPTAYFSQHTTGLALDLGAPRGGQTICFAGVPSVVTGWGSLAAAQAACKRIGGLHYQAYQWLNEHAASYGFYNLQTEPWHWSTSGM